MYPDQYNQPLVIGPLTAQLAIRATHIHNPAAFYQSTMIEIAQDLAEDVARWGNTKIELASSYAYRVWRAENYRRLITTPTQTDGD